MIGVIDAAVVVKALTDSGPVGVWAEQILQRGVHCAPALLPVEVTNAIRLMERGGLLSAVQATGCFREFGRLEIELFNFSPFADRIWALRHTVSSYDAWYVALAEAVVLPLATLDMRLVKSDGPRCRFLTPADP